jgi:hypothetical protein
MAKYKDSKLIFYSILVICLVFFLFFLNLGCKSAPQPELQMYVIPEESPDVYTKVAFLAYGRGTKINGKKSIAGHAAVVIDNADIWGFYPSVAGKFYTAQGILKKNSEHPEIHEYVDFTVDQTLMDEIRELIRSWEKDPPAFIIPLRDCVHFIYQICDIIGLKYKRFALLPVKAVRSIRKLNDTNRIYRAELTPDYPPW